MTSLRSKAGQGALLGLGATALACLLWWSGALERAENVTWDWRVRLTAGADSRTAAFAADSLAVILLDQASLDWGQETSGWSWPWPREVYGAVIGFCKQAGAATLAFDVLFTEPSVYGMADDEALAEAMADFGPFVGALFVHEASAGNAPDRAGGDGPAPSPITLPIPEVAAAAAVLGNVADVPDADGIFRRASLVRLSPDPDLLNRRIPSLGYAQFELARPGASAGLTSVVIDGDPVLGSRAPRPVLRYVAPDRAWPQYGAAAVIRSYLQMMEGSEPTLDPASLRGRHVLFGFSAPGLLDLRPTPLSRVAPGVTVHATVLADLMTDGFIAGTPPAAAVLVHALLAVLTAGLLLGARRSWQTGLVLLGGVAILLVWAWAQASAGRWWPVVPGLGGQVLAMAGALVLAWSTEGRKKRFISQAFGHYLSPAVIAAIMEDPDRLQLGGERRELTIFFSDLAGFTGISEKLDPKDLVVLLNEYLSDMTDIILQEQGTLDKYEGDAIIAFWNAPLDQPDHAARACRTAVLCQRRLADRRAGFKERFGVDLHMRIGLHTGPVTVGNMGSQDRFDYTVLGDAANLASRLEGANKVFGTAVMASQTTVEAAAGAVIARELGDLQVVGRQTAVTVAEITGLAGDPAPGHWPEYARALELCRGGRPQDALPVFAGLGSGPAADPAAAAWAERLQSEAAEPEAFAAVWSLKGK
ncbi:MAG: CHASE2 domain-containing protein [Candidatus Krumholzibacteriia bacterium]